MNGVAMDQTSMQTVDARGLSCPLPLLKAKQGLNNLLPGERLQVLATDAASVKDFHAFAELSCHHLEDFKKDNDIYYYLFVKGVSAVK